MSHEDKSDMPPDKSMEPVPEKSLVPKGSLVKRSGIYVRELRPNALWDALKFIGQRHSDWIPWVAAGVATMNGTILALYQKLKGIPLDWFLIVLLFLFSLGSILVGVILGRRKDKEVPLSPMGTSLPPITPTTEIAAPIEKAECTEEWLHNAAKEQAADICHYVTLVRVIMIDQPSISPGIDFYFHIRNKSLYHISIDSRISGSIRFEGKPLSYPISVLHSELKDCLPLNDEAFLIKQPLTESEAKRIFEYFSDKAESYFSLDDLNITITGVEGFPQFISQRLITTDIKPELPKSDVNKLNDQIKELQQEKARTIEQHSTEIRQLQELAQTHTMRADMRESELEQYRWLIELAERVKKEIRWYVLVIECSVNLHYLEHIEPYIIFSFGIFNASIYDISFDSKVEGYISFNNQKLGGNKELTINLKVFSYGSNSYIKVTQYLSNSAAAAIKKAAETKQGMFKLEHLTIKFSGKDIETTQLKMPEGVYITGIIYP